MWQVQHALHEAFERLIHDAVEQQRNDDGGRKKEDQLQQADLEGVGNRRADVRIGEKLCEVVEADEGAALEAQEWRVVLEGNDVAEERQVAEQDEVHKAGQEKEVDPAFAPENRVRLRSRGFRRFARDGHFASLRMTAAKGRKEVQLLAWNVVEDHVLRGASWSGASRTEGGPG